MKELSYVMVKPDFANNKKVIEMARNKIISAGYKIALEGYIKYSVEASKAHYSDHVEKPFYPALEQYITSDKAYGMVVEGENVIDAIHDSSFMGSTRNPLEGTIRHAGLDIMGYLDRDPSINGRENVAHSSDSVEAAQKEIAIFISLLQKENTTSTDKEL